RAAVGCYDAAKAYRTPFVSGKDSLNNQFKTQDGRVIEIPPTLLISGIGIVPDVSKCVTMDLKPSAGSHIVLLSTIGPPELLPPVERPANCEIASDFTALCAEAARIVAQMIKEGLVLAAHDCSEGGPLVGIAEMLIAGDAQFPDSIGVHVDTSE